METNWEGTKEKVITINDGFDVVKESSQIVGIIAKFCDSNDAQLFTDALHTIQECGLMPSQLLQWQKEAEEQLDLQQTYNRKLTEQNANLKEELQDKAKTNADLTVLLSEEKEKSNKLKDALKPFARMASELIKEKPEARGALYGFNSATLNYEDFIIALLNS